MAPSSADQRKALKDHGLSYYDFHEPNRPRSAYHEDFFSDIRLLGGTNSKEYRDNVTLDARVKPWKRRIRERAKSISERALRCFQRRQNEAGWRMNVEPFVLAQFDMEVNCRLCMARLWRSEIEPEIAMEHSDVSTLRARREQRVACTCPEQERGDVYFENGLNTVFDNVVSQEMIHQGVIPGYPAKHVKGKAPDRIYGLRKTPKLKRILDDTEDVDGNRIGDVVQSSPYGHDHDSLVFPFLVLEAKSEHAPESFPNIYEQTGFPIRTLLILQQKLRDVTKVEDGIVGGPLVWFISYKGRDWCLSAAYTELSNQVRQYYVTELWKGHISDPADALRLILIVDYIFDWARDIYRKDITRALLSLTVMVTPSLVAATDIDIGSVIGRPSDPTLVLRHLADTTSISKSDRTTEKTKTATVSDMYHFYDSNIDNNKYSKGPMRSLAFRDGRIREYRYCALCITTTDDFRQLRGCLDKTRSNLLDLSISKSFVGHELCAINAETLVNIETLWTGRDRNSVLFQSPDTRYVLSLAVVSAFHNGATVYPFGGKPRTWIQRHDLLLVAIEIETMKIIKSPLNPDRLDDQIKHQLVDSKWLLDTLKSIRHSSVRECFDTALAGRVFHLSPHIETLDASREQTLHPGSSLPPRVDYRPHFVEDKCGPSDNLPWAVYKHIKRGINEPDEHFLRSSSTIVDMDTPTYGSSLWSKPESGNAELLQARMVVADRRTLEHASFRYQYCLFTFDDPETADYELSTRPELWKVVALPRTTSIVIGNAFKTRRFKVRPQLVDRRQSTKCLDILLHVLEQLVNFSRIQTELTHGNSPENYDVLPTHVDWWTQNWGTLESGPRHQWPYDLEETLSELQHCHETANLEIRLPKLVQAFTMKIIQMCVAAPSDSMTALRTELEDSHGSVQHMFDFLQKNLHGVQKMVDRPQKLFTSLSPQEHKCGSCSNSENLPADEDSGTVNDAFSHPRNAADHHDPEKITRRSSSSSLSDRRKDKRPRLSSPIVISDSD